jgi:uncharacterized protein YbcI
MDAQPVRSTQPVSERGRQAAAISNAITQLHREFHGRGATTSRTIIQHGYVIVFLHDIYTPLERTLLEAGENQTVLETRQKFQQAMRARFSGAVAEITGRAVVAFMSQVHIDPDMAVEIFMLEPQAGDQPEG